MPQNEGICRLICAVLSRMAHPALSLIAVARTITDLLRISDIYLYNVIEWFLLTRLLKKAFVHGRGGEGRKWRAENQGDRY